MYIIIIFSLWWGQIISYSNPGCIYLFKKTHTHSKDVHVGGNGIIRLTWPSAVDGKSCWERLNLCLSRERVALGDLLIDQDSLFSCGMQHSVKTVDTALVNLFACHSDLMSCVHTGLSVFLSIFWDEVLVLSLFDVKVWFMKLSLVCSFELLRWPPNVPFKFGMI